MKKITLLAVLLAAIAQAATAGEKKAADALYGGSKPLAPPYSVADVLCDKVDDARVVGCQKMVAEAKEARTYSLTVRIDGQERPVELKSNEAPPQQAVDVSGVKVAFDLLHQSPDRPGILHVAIHVSEAGKPTFNDDSLWLPRDRLVFVETNSGKRIIVSLNRETPTHPELN
ncbi:hypothetical protein [Paraburkholderia sp. J8-2]|uniref:hypothetical protein n=1 Tax=Paraburkholderia sp. J8-2 TaxID=2805440 RepID=UPI002AB7B493|nr:hypothetical protein [Paraburkholderia sp. J8-2]